MGTAGVTVWQLMCINTGRQPAAATPVSRPRPHPAPAAAAPRPSAAAAAPPPAAALHPCPCGQAVQVWPVWVLWRKSHSPRQCPQGAAMPTASASATVGHLPPPTAPAPALSCPHRPAHRSRRLRAPPMRRRATAADVLGRGLGGSSSAAREGRVRDCQLVPCPPAGSAWCTGRGVGVFSQAHPQLRRPAHLTAAGCACRCPRLHSPAAGTALPRPAPRPPPAAAAPPRGRSRPRRRGSRPPTCAAQQGEQAVRRSGLALAALPCRGGLTQKQLFPAHTLRRCAAPCPPAAAKTAPQGVPLT